jgi:hypothetical protein
MAEVNADRLAEDIGKIIGQAIKQHVIPRIEALEAQQHELGYKGVWRDGNVYQRGNFVTDGGSLWHCDGEAVTSRPGTNGYDWRLAVKRGAAS